MARQSTRSIDRWMDAHDEPDADLQAESRGHEVKERDRRACARERASVCQHQRQISMRGMEKSSLTY